MPRLYRAYDRIRDDEKFFPTLTGAREWAKELLESGETGLVVISACQVPKLTVRLLADVLNDVGFVERTADLEEWVLTTITGVSRAS